MQYLGIGRKFLSYAASVFRRTPVAEVTREQSVKIAKTLKSHIGLTADTYEKLALLGEEQTVGNLPADMLKAIKKRGGNIDAAIKRVTEGFKQAARDLSGLPKAEIEKLEQRAASQSELTVAKDTLIKTQRPQPIDLTQDLCRMQSDAATSLMESLRGIMPFWGGSVHAKYLGSGMYKNAYQFSFLNAKGKKVFEDVVIGVYKTPEEIVKLKGLREFVPQKIFAQMNDSELMQYLEKHYLRGGNSAAEAKRLASKEFDQIRKIGENLSLEEIEKPIAKRVAAGKKYHGVMAEANATEYIRNLIGHRLTPENNYVLPDMFCIGSNPFSVSRFVSSDMQAPKKAVNTFLLGLQHGDAITINSANTIAGRVIDMGGIKQLWKNNLDNRVSVKYFKKVAGKRSEAEALHAIRRYKHEAFKTSDLTLREKILKAMDLAEQLLFQKG